MGEVPEELIMQCYEAIHAITPVESVTTKELNRPRVKVIFDVIYRISNATGFPDPTIVIANELPKEMKQQRIDYIQKIINLTGERLGETVDCQAKNITAGKEVPQTLVFLIRLCAAATQGAPAEPDAPEPEPAEPPMADTAEDNQYGQLGGQFDGAGAHMAEHEPATLEAQFPVGPAEPADPVEPEPEPQVQEPEPPAPVAPYQEPPEQFQAAPYQPPSQAPYQAAPEEATAPVTGAGGSQHFALGQSDIGGAPADTERDGQQRAQEVLANAFGASEKAVFQRPPPSQQRRREQKQESSSQQKTNFRVRIERDDDDDDDPLNAAAPDTNILGGDFGADTELNGIFGDIPTPADAEKGALMADIENVYNEFNQGVPTSQQEKRQAAQQKISNQANSKLLQAIHEAVRGVIPFSKATSFLEEHLVRMRQELIQAVDDCAGQNQLRQKNASIENKARSLQEARLRSVEEQIAAAKLQLCELADAVVV